MDSAKRHKKSISPEEAHQVTIKIIEYLLDVCVVEQDQSTLADFGAEKQVLFVSQNEIPTLDSSDTIGQVRSLLAQRLEREIDGIKYSISVYQRSVNSKSDWDTQIWERLSKATQNALALIVLDILIQATSTQEREDLFGFFSKESKGTHGDIGTFLDCISGWSSDGLFPTPLLQSITKQAQSTLQGKRAIVLVIQSAMKDIKSIKRPDEIMSEGNKLFVALETLLSEGSVLEILGEKLLEEVVEGVMKLGDYFERDGVFGPLLSVSTFIQNINPLMLQSTQYSCFTSLRGFPNLFQSDVEQLHSTIQDGIHKCQSILHSTLLLLLKRPSSKNNVLTWMSAVVSLNEMRAGPKYELKKSRQGTASDGFLANFCMVLLEFCRPFFSSHSSAPKLPLIVSDYPTSSVCRLDLHNEPCLVNGMIAAPDRFSKGHERFQCLGGSYKFVTECFFITLRALHIGLLPVTETFLSTLSDIGKELDRKGGQDKLLTDLNGLYLVAGSCCLLDPKLVQYCSEFYITHAVWLTMLLESCHKEGLSEEKVKLQQQKLFSSIPEHGVKDMVRWFLFVLRTRAKLLQGLQLTPFVDCCISLLERPDLLPGPVAQSQIISVLLACVGRDRGHNNPQRLLSTDSWGGIQGELSAMVQGSPAFQSRLGPALLHTYSAVSVVEGLDVDKENFDKYSARYDICQLLLHLWSRVDCRESIIAQTGSRQFESFLGAIWDTLLYTLNDGLLRITNIHRMELAKDNSQVWSKLSGEEKRKKDAFLSGEQRASRALLSMSSTLLSLLESVTEVESITKHFCTPPLSQRTAGAIMGFLDLLCGARQNELKIKDPERLHFDPRKIVSQIATVIARIWQVESTNGTEKNGFTCSLANHPDYSRSVVNKVASVLERHQLCGGDIIVLYRSFLEQLDTYTGGPGDPLAQASKAIGQASSTPPGTVAQWQNEAEAVQLDKQILHEMYSGALQDNLYDSATLQGVHSLEDKAVITLDPRSPRVRAILRDVKQLQESLSVHPDSSIFVRQDEDRMDLVRVLITGPVDTPYSYGCYVFDIYYPANYPVNPPLVLLTTTGNGTVRFNPNLYADGKVCLSLLGTWHGGDSSEKWDPVQSNLMQVLVSIQGLILIPEPIYNEPGYEAMQGTPQGKIRSSQYNAYVQINTVRYAMLEQLRHPPIGFEDTVRIHFMLLRDAVLRQCSQWLRQVVSVDHEQKLRRAVDELRKELDKL